ncbi:MAG: hypothetical protein ABIO17_00830 [Pseudoxanthomonas sp.]
MAYPGLFRLFAAAIVLALLCGMAAAATQSSKALHPAPFIALGLLSAIAAPLAFACMLLRVAASAIRGGWQRRVRQ